jgi:hypothetical protein
MTGGGPTRACQSEGNGAGCSSAPSSRGRGNGNGGKSSHMPFKFATVSSSTLLWLSLSPAPQAIVVAGDVVSQSKGFIKSTYKALHANVIRRITHAPVYVL